MNSILQHLFTGLADSGKSAFVQLEDDSLIEGITHHDTPPRKLLGRIPYQVPMQKGLRLLLVLAALVVGITFILHYSFVLIKDSLLFQGEINVNEKGALLPTKSFEREYGIFLFNTSELWADTGIRVEKGDLLRISASGAFHSSVGDLYAYAKDNTSDSTIIHWNGGNDRFEGIAQQKEKNDYLLNNKEKMGDVLFSIVPDHEMPMKIEGEAMNQITADKGVTAPRSGNLFVTINDIYFPTDSTLREYGKQSFSTRFGAPFPVETLIKGNKPYHTIFYNDNLGQILLTVEIQHPLKTSFFRIDFFNPRKHYRKLETQLEHSKNFFSSVWYYLVFVGAIILIYATWTIVVLGGIYLLFLVGYWLWELFRLLIRYMRGSVVA